MLIQQSYKLGDYRVAVKYLFLKTLHQLAGRSFIEYAVDKTNYQYLREISPDKRNEFSKLVLNYEYIWYGNVNIGRELYDNLEKDFTAFQHKIR
jgi:hypothetical protein